MKFRYLIYLPVFASLLLSSCAEEEQPGSEDISSRPTSSLSVKYLIGEETVSSIAFDSKAAVRTVDVQINNANLNWNVESDRNWCKVRSEAHRGSGSFTIEVSANEDFDDRDAATVTFVAGGFRGFTLGVSQSGAAFIVDQPYFVVSNRQKSLSVVVTTLEGTDWEVSSPSWISASRSAAHTADGYTTTTLTVDVDANDDPTRYGSVLLTASDGRMGGVDLAQLGSELSWDQDGNIFLGEEDSGSITFRAPDFMIASFNVPDYVTPSVTPSEDGTVDVTLTFEDNLSDCAEIRESVISIVLDNNSVSTVTLPSVRQDYIPAHGLVTPKGLLLFAQAVAAGDDTSEWETDGTVVLRSDLDLSDVSGWRGIGSDEHPFAGVFDGGGHTVTNLKKATSGFFHYIKGGTVRNLTIGSGCTSYLSGSFEETLSFGGLADLVERGTITSCNYSGNLEFAAVASGTVTARIGGIAGYADPLSKITSCRTSGVIAISSSTDPYTTLYAGGIAGQSGEVQRCEFSGQLSFGAGITKPRIGGILGYLGAGDRVSGNSFLGTLKLDGAASDIRIGGLYAVTGGGERVFDNASDKSVSRGTVEIASYFADEGTTIFAGGFVGFTETESPITFKGYDLQTSFLIDNTANRASACLAVGGALGGCNPEDDGAAVTFEGIINRGAVRLAYASGVTLKGKKTFYGGLAGMVKGALKVSDCSNEGQIGIPTNALGGAPYSANTANFMVVIGGLVASAEGGNAEFTGCSNSGALFNYQYNNRVVPNHVYEEHYCGNVTSGILGVFDYYPADGGFTLKMTDCSNAELVSGFRGLVASIVGYAKNATISGCTASADLLSADNQSNASHKGGIAAVLGPNSTVSGCTAKISLSSTNPGGALGTPGGIVGAAVSSLSITNCSWYGTVSGTVTDGAVFGGLLGTGTAQTTISSCKYGGKVGGATISENNVESNAIGNAIGTLKDITYWDGN